MCRPLLRLRQQTDKVWSPSYLQKAEGALDEAARRVLLLAKLRLQDGLLLLHQGQGHRGGGQQQLGVRTQTHIWTTHSTFHDNIFTVSPHLEPVRPPSEVFSCRTIKTSLKKESTLFDSHLRSKQAPPPLPTESLAWPPETPSPSASGAW